MIKILWLERNLIDARLIQDQLNAEISLKSQVDLNFVYVCHLDQAIRFLETESFDLFLLEFPLVDRLEANPLSAFLQIHNRFPLLPIILLSELEDKTLMFQVLGMGRNWYILKKDLSTKILSSIFFDLIKSKL